MTIDLDTRAPHDPDATWLHGGGEAGALIRAFDWSKTDLGPLDAWPRSLRTIVGTLLLSPVPIVLLWGEKGSMIYNDAYSVFAGNRHPRLLGSEVRRGWDEIADFNDNVMRVGLAGGTLSYRDQQLMLERSGRLEPAWMNLDYSPVIDESGRPGGVISIVVETTERVRAEESIRENEARLRFLDALGERTATRTDADRIMAVTTRMLGEHLDVSVCAYADMDDDQDGFTIRGDWAAPGSASIVGRYRLADFGRLAVERLRAGKPLVLDDNASQLPPDEARTFAGLGLAATICMPLIKEGRLTALMAIHDRRPHPWHAREQALLAEVTARSWAHIERVRAEVAIRAGEKRFLDELEAKVAERTAALRQSEANIRKAEQALVQAQKMEALGSLTGGIAHDFNNLLMAVMGSMELLRERLPPDPTLRRLVDHALAGAERGSSLTRRMLAFARRQDLKTERIDLWRLIDGMSELMQRSLGPTVIVEIRHTPSLPHVEADTNQLESALLNLAVNARDAMDGVGTITIAADDVWVRDGHERLVPGHYVCLSLTDTGSGMDAATLERATEPFFTTKGVGKGTGLGLSMVHGLAEQSGGTLIVRSRVDVGTTAEIWLPAAASVDRMAPADTVAAAPLVDASRCDAVEALAILTVDDDDLVRSTTVEMLEDLGYRAIPARSGAEALRLLESTCVNLVITDHAMPQMTGAQLAAQLRERYPDLPVVMATGYAELSHDGPLTLPRLAKPYTQASLADVVAKAVAR